MISGCRLPSPAWKTLAQRRPYFRLHLGDGVQHLGQALARDGAVHAVVVGRDAADRRERRPCARPRSAAARPRTPETRSSVAPLPSSTARIAAISSATSVGGAVGFAQQDRLGIQVVAGLDEGLDRGGGRLVHHLEAGRDDAGGDDGGHRIAGLLHVVEAGHDHLCHLGLGRELDRDLGDDGEQALGAGHQRQQVVARRIEGVVAELDHLAGHGHAAHAQHVVHGQAVLEAMHAARVLGDIAADGAGDLRAGVGRIVEAVGRGRLGDGEVAHAGLHHGEARHRVEMHDLLHLGQRQHHAVLVRQRAARKAGAGAARHHRHAEFVADLAAPPPPAPRWPPAPRPAAGGDRRRGRRIRRACRSSAVASSAVAGTMRASPASR